MLAFLGVFKRLSVKWIVHPSSQSLPQMRLFLKGRASRPVCTISQAEFRRSWIPNEHEHEHSICEGVFAKSKNKLHLTRCAVPNGALNREISIDVGWG